MSLRKAACRELTLMPPQKRPLYQSGEAPQFDREQAVLIKGHVQPLSSQMEAALYGEKARRMLLLFTEKKAPLAEGMGVCVHALPEEGCDFRISAPPESWGRHKRAVLEQLSGS